MEEANQIQQPQPKRPQLLTILCIVTFIGSGLAAFSYLVFAAYYTDMIELMEIYYADRPEFNYFLNAPREFFIYAFLLSAASVLGAFMMWNLRKVGFHVYAVSQLIGLILPSVYFGGDVNPLLNIMFTAFFVYLYARNLRFMH